MDLFTQIALMGILAGFYCSIWGAVKDSKYEGFKLLSFIRSPLVGLFSAAIVWIFLLNSPGTVVSLPFLYFFICMGFERQTTESYKAFIRVENQKKYRIPEYVSAWGHVFKNRFLRLFFGIIFLTAFFSFIFWLRSYLLSTNFPAFIDIILATSVGGLYASLFGANKDAPYEGFEKLKIWRSEVVTILFGFAFSPFISDYILLGYAASGAERAAVEFYKTFILHKKPGKFK